MLNIIRNFHLGSKLSLYSLWQCVFISTSSPVFGNISVCVCCHSSECEVLPWWFKLVFSWWLMMLNFLIYIKTIYMPYVCVWVWNRFPSILCNFAPLLSFKKTSLCEFFTSSEYKSPVGYINHKYFLPVFGLSALFQ